MHLRRHSFAISLSLEEKMLSISRSDKSGMGKAQSVSPTAKGICMVFHDKSSGFLDHTIPCPCISPVLCLRNRKIMPERNSEHLINKLSDRFSVTIFSMQPSRTVGAKATYSWWILFIGCRVPVVFSLARGLAFFLSNFFEVTNRRFVKIVGGKGSLIIAQGQVSKIASTAACLS